MKKALYFIAAALVSFSMASCEKEQHAENLKVQYYADFEVEGGLEYIVPIGTSWVDPGFKATVRGVDVTSQIVVEDEVDDSEIGAYKVTYTYTTEDGFSNNVVRTVYVCNPAVTTDLEGSWKTIAGTYRDNREGKLTQYPGFTVKIKKICPGFFSIDDMLGQYYTEYVGYGPQYDYAYDFAADANWSLNPDNSIDMISGGYVGAWGDYAGPLSNASYDPATETISFVIEYAEMDFYVVMQREQ